LPFSIPHAFTLEQVRGMKNVKEPIDFISALIKLQEECGVVGLKMSGLWYYA
jgi:hypothetical protein